jgi:hypothetical protein
MRRAWFAAIACGSRIVLKKTIAHHTLLPAFSHLKPFGTGPFCCGPLSLSLHSGPSFVAPRRSGRLVFSAPRCRRLLFLPESSHPDEVLRISSLLRTRRRNHRLILPRWHVFRWDAKAEKLHRLAPILRCTCNGVFPQKDQASYSTNTIPPAIGHRETPAAKSIAAAPENRVQLPRTTTNAAKDCPLASSSWW